MISLVLAGLLFVFTSCGNNYQKALDSEQGIANGESTAKTTTAEDTNTTGQPANPAEQQIIEVTAQSGGYSPRKIEAKAGIPTILVMKSEGAYGCERAFNIPDLKV